MSMVLIIIALIVVSYTSVTSMIETAKIRSFASEMNSWKRNISVFYSLEDRLPGDLKEQTYIGEYYNSNWELYSRRSYRLSDIGISTYKGLSADTYMSSCFAFWLDLFLKDINDFEPEALGVGGCGTRASAPLVLSDKFRTNGPISISFPNNKGKWPQFYNEMNGIYFQFISIEDNAKPKVLFKIDEKIDDGYFNSGDMRSFCFTDVNDKSAINSRDYQESIQDDYLCTDFYYKVTNLDI